MQEQMDAVQRMQDYIETHIFENITPADLAGVSLFSPWYSNRLFKEYTNYNPGDYIRRLKLSKSALRLRDEGCKIIDIAFDLGFKSVDGYQRAFYREFGCNPHEYAKSPTPLYLFTPYGVKYRTYIKETKSMQDAKNVFIQIIEKPERKLILKRGITATDYITYCDEVGCDVWGLLTSIRSISGEPVCIWLPERFRTPGTSEYVQGVEVSLTSTEEVPEGFDCITLPPARFLFFRGEPFREENFCDAIDELRNSMEKYDPAILGCHWKEDGMKIQLEPLGTRGYIEMREID